MTETNRQLTEKILFLVKAGKISKLSRLIYVDDGSKDETWRKIEEISTKKGTNLKITGIKLAKNVGHQNALMAGMMFAVGEKTALKEETETRREEADAVVTIDADMQDDVDAIDKMLEKFVEGAEIVYGVRSDRKTDSSFKRFTAQGFYKLMKFLGVEMIYNAADFRLMSKRAIKELAKYEEVNVFLRGIVPLIGLKSAEVKYARRERTAGESKYPTHKMIHFALDGVTSFSVKPIRMVFTIGMIIFLLAGAMTIYAVVQKLTGNTVSGWTFTICSVWMLGGLQMAAIGLIGEYIGKIYAETKRRPKWIVEKINEG